MRVTSVVENFSVKQKVPGLIPGLVSYEGHGLFMMKHFSCNLLLEKSTTFQRLWCWRSLSPIQKEQLRKFWSFVSDDITYIYMIIADA